MDSIRIIDLPACKMASSGCSTEPDGFSEKGVLGRFNRWWTELDARREDKFFPRDFMWYDREKKGLVWYYALTSGVASQGDVGSLVAAAGFEVVDFPGGLYAAAVSRDGDEEDGQRVYQAVKDWVTVSSGFDLDERPGHYDMFRIITPSEAAKSLGYRQLEILVPIRVRAFVPTP